MCTIVYFSAKSRNTERFIQKIREENEWNENPLDLKIRKLPCEGIDEPFILVTPTYADHIGERAIPPIVEKFLEKNYMNMIGVIGGGNKNFGEFFAQGANKISSLYQVPILHKFELAGFQEDVDKVYNIIKEMKRHEQ